MRNDLGRSMQPRWESDDSQDRDLTHFPTAIIAISYLIARAVEVEKVVVVEGKV